MLGADAAISPAAGVERAPLIVPPDRRHSRSPCRSRRHEDGRRHDHEGRELIVRVELQDGQVGWGEAPSAPTMTGDTLGSLTAAVRDHLAPHPHRQRTYGQRTDYRPMLQRALVGNTSAHSAIEWRCSMPACRATNSRLIDVAMKTPAHAVTSARCGCSANATVEEDIAEARAKAPRGL
jgi:muconate cycloisomerase